MPDQAGARPAARSSLARQAGHTSWALRPYRQVSPRQREHGPTCSGEQPSMSAADTRSVVGSIRLDVSSMYPNLCQAPDSGGPW